MKQTINMAGSPPHAEVIAIITDAIRTVSAKARDVAITPQSLLLEELSLDSLDLVAVILQLQDHFQVEIDPDEITNVRRVDDLAVSLTKQIRAAA
jgi:acyl carrier protein